MSKWGGRSTSVSVSASSRKRKKKRNGSPINRIVTVPHCYRCCPQHSRNLHRDRRQVEVEFIISIKGTCAMVRGSTKSTQHPDRSDSDSTGSMAAAVGLNAVIEVMGRQVAVFP